MCSFKTAHLLIFVQSKLSTNVIAVESFQHPDGNLFYLFIIYYYYYYCGDPNINNKPLSPLIRCKIKSTPPPLKVRNANIYIYIPVYCIYIIHILVIYIYIYTTIVCIKNLEMKYRSTDYRSTDTSPFVMFLFVKKKNKKFCHQGGGKQKNGCGWGGGERGLWEREKEEKL